MEWPPQSPDLNSIEHLWGELKKELGKHNTIAKSESKLLKRVEAEWASIAPGTCQTLIESMFRHIQAVLKAKKGNTKY
ncbi:uncharacterized protein MEPE_01892 [Melanopsichium pennsylvanicum]|uniref:Tc1-like transposase DDE domain-containing protein n=1 Tax=Melanopsichium pennsylvanicum TaxID=63383 RepID=A0AAJ4XJX9_9BASI|nr:uncharacterized protein MEPE_01892 [Melanopsichium pennsylvanicum]